PSAEDLDMLEAHVREVDEIHGKFQPRKTELIPWRQYAIELKSRFRRMRANVEFEEADRINHLRERKLLMQRTSWAWKERLGLLNYARPDWSEPYVYLALQNGIDVKLTVRNPAFVEQ